MKVLPVSFKSRYVMNNYDSEFFFYKQEHKKNNRIEQGYILATAFMAATAVSIALFNIGKTKRLPDSIVELADSSIGLNKIKDQERVVDIIKSKFIYPIKATELGDKAVGKEFKSGLIITGENPKDTSKITNAVCEHFKNLGIESVNVNTTLQREKNSEVYSRKLKKNEITKQVYKVFENAKENYEKTGKFTLLNLGNLDDITTLKIVKSTVSKMDKLLSEITNKKSPGVIWIGWTTKQKSLPMFFKELPVITTKLN